MFDTQFKKAYTLGGLTVLVLLVTLIFTTGITFNQNHPDPPAPAISKLDNNMESKQINLDKQKQPFPDGIYYEYGAASDESEKPSEDQIHHPELILGYIAGHGANLQEAWYRSYASSCSKPGSNMAMDVIVPAKLLIRVEQPLSDAQQKRIGLSRVNSPSFSSCPYYIRHYTFNSQE